MQCELCDQPAAYQVTDVDSVGEPTHHFYCNEHVPADLTCENPAVEILLPFLRNLRDFVRREDRLPSPEEVAELGGEQSLPAVEARSLALHEGVAHLERLIAFIEAQQRLPEPSEMAIDPPSWYLAC